MPNNFRSMPRIMKALSLSSEKYLSATALNKKIDGETLPKTREYLLKYTDQRAPMDRLWHIYEPEHLGDARFRLFTTRLYGKGRMLIFFKRSVKTSNKTAWQQARGAEKQPFFTRAHTVEEGKRVSMRPKKKVMITPYWFSNSEIRIDYQYTPQHDGFKLLLRQFYEGAGRQFIRKDIVLYNKKSIKKMAAATRKAYVPL